ncbi:DNA metabolism protein [Lithospermum erythrorhizon]|uniref:DNA metabolism protein n=1 Tax=Lithospermum erythrorhizon TaxID=34254 RepID=A0AAV3RD73_LITER
MPTLNPLCQFSTTIFSKLTSSFITPYPILTPNGRKTTTTNLRIHLKNTAFLNKNINNGSSSNNIVIDSLKLLEWDNLCDSVASFASTTMAKQALKEQLWCLDQSYEDSLKLLKETNAAVQMNNYGAMMDFAAIDILLVQSAIQNARRGFAVSGDEAIALAVTLEFAEALQLNVKAAIKADSDCHQHFMPLTQTILELIVDRSLIKSVRQMVDDDGTVKDSASSALKQARDQVRYFERKLNQMMESLIRKEMEETPSLEVRNINGRWCITSAADNKLSFQGLLLSSGSGAGSVVEPLDAVPLNDELQQARASVVKAETDVLFKITQMMQRDLDNIKIIFNDLIQLDIINARARYSISYGGAYPDLYWPQDEETYLIADTNSMDSISMESHPSQRKWTLNLRKAYHPLLLQKHQRQMKKSVKDLTDAKSEMKRRRRQGVTARLIVEKDIDISSLEMQVAKLKESPPIPIDIFVDQKTRVLVITGPNTGGKTICLKTVGLAAMMAKSGLYVLASDPVKIPWFDCVFADIGDEQSLSQSLSTFSGHLKRISDIRAHSTNLSLVLLDEVGAGTNPLEGAALGMSLLESFAEGGALLTMATTHHGELKTLKYSNDAFENACMEFDEVNLKPTYKILWGVPGRSNAINIAERLGMPDEVLRYARELYGVASAEINEIILDMERLKQNTEELNREAQHHLILVEDLRQKILLSSENIRQHRINLSLKKAQEITGAAAVARSILHKRVREQRTISAQRSRSSTNPKSTSSSHQTTTRKNDISSSAESVNSLNDNEKPLSGVSPVQIKQKSRRIPKVGEMVYVSSLKKKVMVLEVEQSKEEIVVQAGFMKMKLSIADLVIT